VASDPRCNDQEDRQRCRREKGQPRTDPLGQERQQHQRSHRRPPASPREPSLSEVRGIEGGHASPGYDAALILETAHVPG
jgi:hypothetical protein